MHALIAWSSAGAALLVLACVGVRLMLERRARRDAALRWSSALEALASGTTRVNLDVPAPSRDRGDPGMARAINRLARASNDLGTELITQRRSQQRADSRLTALLELLPDAVFSVNAEGIVTSANRSAERLFRPASGSLVGLPLHGLLMHPEGLPPCSLSELATLRPSGWHTRGLRACAGDSFPVKVAATQAGSYAAGDDETLVVVTDQSLLSATEDQCRRSHALFQTLYENAPVMVAGFDASGRCVLWNREAERVLGWSLDEVSRLPDHARLLFPDPRERDEARRLFLARDGVFRQVRPTARDGRQLEHEWASFELDDGLVICTGHDVTARRQVEGRLEETSHELDAILQNVMVGIAHIVDGRFQHVNLRLEQMLGAGSGDLPGRAVSDFADEPDAFRDLLPEIARGIGAHAHWNRECRMQRSDGSRFWCALSVTATATAGRHAGQIWLFEDITRRRQTEEQLRELASYDTLTGLPNRSLFIHRLSEAVNGYHSDEPFTLMFIDLDHFKDVNDSLGHRAGDDLLCQVARRLTDCVGEAGLVARLGGDEFTVLITPGRGDAAAAALAERIISAISQPFLLEGHEANVSPSIGISRFPLDGEEVGVLLRNADTAMYLAKSAGRNTYRFYSPELHEAAQGRMRLVGCVRRAVEQQSFTLVYQPLVDLATGGWTGVEALLRLPASELGPLAPDIFVPILEETGLIVQLGEWVLERALSDTQPLREAGLVLAVNISGRQFREDDFVERVAATLTRHQVPAELLELELTETVLMADTEASVAALDALSALGVRLSVDDFGMGYSSLAYLKRFPIDAIKIDRSFVRDIPTDEDDAAIVEAIVAMAHRLRVTVVAEGVETLAQRDFLQSVAVQRGQGYLYARPMPLGKLLEARAIQAAKAPPTLRVV